MGPWSLKEYSNAYKASVAPKQLSVSNVVASETATTSHFPPFFRREAITRFGRGRRLLEFEVANENPYEAKVVQESELLGYVQRDGKSLKK